MSSIWKKEWRVQNKNPGKYLKEVLRYKNKVFMSNLKRCREFQLAGILKNRVEERTGAWSPYLDVGYNIYKSLAKSSRGKSLHQRHSSKKYLPFTSGMSPTCSDTGIIYTCCFPFYVCLYFSEFRWVHITYILTYILSCKYIYIFTKILFKFIILF